MVHSEPWKWDQIAGERWREPEPIAYYLADRWRKQRRKRFLDLGCGPGRHALFFAANGFTVDGYDLSPSGVAELEARAREKGLEVTTNVGDMLALPYPDGEFDCLMAFHVIYHSNRAGTERAISEMHRVLAQGGEAYVTFNSRSSRSYTNPANVRVDEHTIIKTEGREPGVPHYYVDESEVRRLMAGFDLVMFDHRQEFHEERVSYHYYLLARKR